MDRFEIANSEFFLTTDKAQLCNQKMHELLKTTPWAHNRSREAVEISIQNSLTFGVLKNGIQIAMARVVTDYVSFAWVCDVVVEEKFRNLGIGRRMMNAIEVHPALANVRRYLLCTQSAKGLYLKLGYEELPNDSKTWMIRLFPERDEARS